MALANRRRRRRYSVLSRCAARLAHSLTRRRIVWRSSHVRALPNVRHERGICRLFGDYLTSFEWGTLGDIENEKS